MKKISIIIPVYNSQQYLEQCLSSVILQTYPNLEIICVDDGSTDGSGEIVDQFAQRDKRIIALHQKNAGESNARNVALERATGDYIGFCDCDDWIEPDMYRQMETVMETEGLDLVATGWYKENNGLCEEIKNKLPVSQGVIERDLLLKYIYKRDSYKGFAYIWNKLYNRNILYYPSGQMIRFNESLTLGGDILFLAEIAINVRKAKYINCAFYHYIQRSLSGCHTKDLNNLRDWIRAYELVLCIFEKENVEADTIEYVKRFLAYQSSNFAQIAYEQGNSDMLNLYQEFMNMYKKEYISLNQMFPERIERYLKILSYVL